MANSSFVLSGNHFLSDPSISTNSGAGNGGTLTIIDGTAIFESSWQIEVLLKDTTTDGEIDGSTKVVGLMVYASDADYQSGTVLYSYEPMNPGQYAEIQSDLTGLGDSYVRFNANVLVSSDSGAPVLSTLIAANEPLVDELASGPITLDRLTDYDFDDDGAIDEGTNEEANGLFNVDGAPCLVAGTLVRTPTGARPVEEIRAGDLVDVLDGPPQRVRWSGQRTVCGTGRLAPIRIDAGVLGNSRSLRVSPNHRMLIQGAVAELHYGTPEILVAAEHLTDNPGIAAQPCERVTYCHLLFDSHQVIFAEDCPTESLHPGQMAINAMGSDTRPELLRLFPDLSTQARERPLSRLAPCRAELVPLLAGQATQRPHSALRA
ncbi:Hint domain-containing protein [Tropicimonas sp. TH_r6]|uniref:Hint domain-containing protein n=1 Tax=Tropicimonas sp. TH_r6 TaxID=3082085 RepID=UPI0029530CF0|nr:Hint domain-containing protein [Tropicimonas sp. TH_r6]MDV7145047.1 Hint domain-containing protein [Tropicimonas sp. TH_r6]